MMWAERVAIQQRLRTFVASLVLVGICAVFIPTSVSGQELNARVEILSPQLPHTNKRVLEVLQRVVSDFLNKRSWTGMQVRPEERIDCSIVITIHTWDGSSAFTGQAQIMSMRPVFNTSYASPVLNMVDKEFNFAYTEGQIVDYSDQQFSGNLTALLAYYAYIIVGMDGDTFSPNGGDAAYKAAQQVVNNAQSSSYEGWRAMAGEGTRYWLIQNLMDRRYQPIRDFLYSFSRNGLDRLSENAPEARQQMVAELSKLQSIERFGQSSVLDQVFFAAKSSELVGVLSGLAPRERIQVYNLLSAMDPSNTNKYEALRNQ